MPGWSSVVLSTWCIVSVVFNVKHLQTIGEQNERIQELTGVNENLVREYEDVRDRAQLGARVSLFLPPGLCSFSLPLRGRLLSRLCGDINSICCVAEGAGPLSPTARATAA